MKLTRTKKEGIIEAIDRVNDLADQHQSLVEEMEEGVEELKVAIEEAGMEFGGTTGRIILKAVEDTLPYTTRLPADLLEKIKKCMAEE